MVDAELLGYVRISEREKRKGQNPERQKDVAHGWIEAERARKHRLRLHEFFVDDGVSASKTNPFERAAFQKMLEKAASLRAEGVPIKAVLVEVVDRFTRQGSEEYGWAVVELRKKHGLELWSTDLPLDQQGELAGRIKRGLDADLANESMKLHGKKVSAGMRTKQKKHGKSSVGRPSKALTKDEITLLWKLHGEGNGVRRITVAVNKARGVHEIEDRAARGKRSVSRHVVHEYVTGVRK